MTISLDDFLEDTARNEPPPDGETFIFASEEDMVSALNAKTGIVQEGRQVRYLLRARGGLVLLAKRDAEVVFAPYQLEIQGEKSSVLKPALPIYTKSPSRRFFEGVVCVPNAGEQVGDALNTWHGFALEGRPGCWTKMQSHLRKFVCNGNDEHFVWLMSWMAQTLQDPQHKMGTAVVLVGGKGAGKSTVVEWLFKMIGAQHSHRVSNQRHVTGHFNKHLMTCLLLNIDEATWGGDRGVEAILKDLITGSTFTIEAKGVDAVQAPNFTRVLITSNPAWIVPATQGERRFFVLRVAMPFGDLSEDEGNTARRQYFAELEQELRDGGAEAMMHDLLQWDWRQVDLRKPPVTEALAEQMARTFSSAEDWMISVLSAGGFVDEDSNIIIDGEWPLDQSVTIPTSIIVQSYRQHVRAYDGRGASAQRIVRLLKEFGPLEKARMHKGDGRPWGYRFPPLQEWRDRVSAALKVDFEEPVAEVVPLRRERGRAA